MTFPRRLTFALFLICCLQHANASTSLITTPMTSATASSNVTAQASSNMIAQASSSMTVQASSNMTAEASSNMTAQASSSMTVQASSSMGSTSAFAMATNSTMVGKSIAATGVSTSTNVSTTATGVLTSATHKATNSSSAYTHITNTPVTTLSSMSTMQIASFSIGSYSSPDCKSCSNGGTITVTMSCTIKIKGSGDNKCDQEKFNGTRCDYVTLANKTYGCAEVKKNFTYYEKEHLKSVKECKVVCPASGSVLSPHIVAIFASGLVVGMLSQTL